MGPILPGPGSLGRGAGVGPAVWPVFFFENTSQNKDETPETPPPPPRLPGSCRVAMLTGSFRGAPSMAPGGTMFAWPIAAGVKRNSDMLECCGMLRVESCALHVEAMLQWRFWKVRQ